MLSEATILRAAEAALSLTATTHYERNAMSDLKIGLASVCTTPDEPVWLHGYLTEHRFHPHDGVLHDLHARAMAFEDDDGERGVLIALDLCILRAPEARIVAQRLAQATGLPEERIILNLSHTHSGPIVGRSDLHRFPMSEEERANTVACTETLVDRLADVAAAALDDLRPARLSWGRGAVDFVRNRRKFDAKGNYTGMGPNPDGFTDPRVTVLRVDAPDGEVRALLCSLACHAVTLGPKNLKISSDYPGPARAGIEAAFPGAMALFVQGCGADANPEPRSTPDQVEWTERHGEALAAEVARVAEGPLEPVTGPIRAAQAWVDLPLRAMSREEAQAMAEGPGYYQYNAQRLLELMDAREAPATAYRAPVALWRFDDALTLVALPGETVSGYIPRIENALADGPVWVAGYCNEVFGYLPTARIIAEGGYEDRGLISEIGYFDPSVEDTVVGFVTQLAEEVRTQ